MSTTVELTPAGVAYAFDHVGDSIVARVAAVGYDAGWPAEYVRTAIVACNDAGTSTVYRPFDPQGDVEPYDVAADWTERA